MRLDKLWINFLLILGLNFGADFHNYGFSLLTHALKRASVLEERLEFRIKEGTETDTLIGKIKKRPNYSYRLNEKNPWFSFNPETGEIRTLSDLDREKLPSDVVDLVILGSSPTYFITVRIFIDDLNDNAPYFPFPFQNISIPESAQPGTQLRISSAQDPDKGDNGRIAGYEIVSGNEAGIFSLAESGQLGGEIVIILQISKELDREKQGLYVLNISAVDAGNPPKYGFVTVFVNILDSNDNAPIFKENHYKVSVRETVEAGSPVLQVNASDLDIGENGQIVYYISNDPESQFEIDSLSGLITTKVEKLKCPQKSCVNGDNCSRVCVFTVEALDHGIPAQRGRAFVNVEIIDENDHDPEIRFRIYPAGSEYATVDETKEIGSVIAVVTVMDQDSGDNGRTAVRIEQGDPQKHFRLESNELFSLIRVNALLDRENIPKYNLSILATDFGNPPRFNRKYLPIFVRDVNDQPPVFEKSEYFAQIPENLPIGSFVISVSAKDMDSATEQGPISGIFYAIISGNEGGYFQISGKTGLVTTARILDFESIRHYSLKIKATDGGLSAETSVASVEIEVLDANDHAPKFSKPTYRLKISENILVGSEILQLSASDLDSGRNSELKFELAPETEARYPGQFVIDEKSGLITAGKNFDREKESFYRFSVIVSDNGKPKLSDSADILLGIDDENDNHPVFYPTQYFANALKSSAGKTLISKITASDSDTGNNAKINYFLLDAPIGFFEIDTSTGDLFLLKQPTNTNRISATVGATDGNNLPASNSASVQIFLLDTLGDTPKFVAQNFEFTVKEDSEGSTSVGKAIGTVSATDFEDSAPIEYKIIDGDQNGIFEIGQYSGEIRSSKPIDRELKESYDLIVGAIGTGGFSQSNARIVVEDINDNSPKFISQEIRNGFAECVVEKAWPVGYPVFFATATDRDSNENGKLRYFFKSHSDKFSIDSETGLIALIVPGFMLANDSYSLDVSVTDAGNPPKVVSFHLRIFVNTSQNQEDSYESHNVALYVPEDTPVNSRLQKLAPSGGQKDVYFESVSDGPEQPFGIFPDGWLFVKNHLDFESLVDYQLNVLRVEFSENGRRTERRIAVDFHILDANDNAPICQNQTFQFQFPENSPPFSFIGALRVEDLDTGLNGKLAFELMNEKEKFLLDAVSGILSSKVIFDREHLIKTTGSSKIRAKFRVSDHDSSGGQNSHSVQCEIEVDVSDRNDRAPQFSLEMYAATVPENMQTGSELLRVTATDEDEGTNGMIQYQIASGNEDGRFDLEEASGRLLLKKPLDRETKSEYRLKILATDFGDPSLNSSAFAVIKVTDINDQIPRFVDFPRQGLNLSESLPVGSLVAQFRAVDKDIGSAGRVRYFIATGNIGRTFEMSPVTGKMILIKPLDFEAVPAYTLTVSATDEGAPSLSASVPVVINVLDFNDNAPKITAASLVGQVSENVPPGTKVLTVTATDGDSGMNGRVRFTIAEQTPKLAFHIDEQTGEIFTAAELDRESIDSFKLRVVVEDSPEDSAQVLASERIVTIIVTDANDLAPEFTSPHAAVVSIGARSGQKISRIRAKDGDAGLNATVGYTIQEDSNSYSNMFGLDQDGTLYLKRPVTYSSKPLYHMTLVATDRLDLSRNGGSRRRRREGKDQLEQTTSIQFTVIVSSSTPNDLKFARDNYEFDVSEGSAVGTEIGRVSAAEIPSSGRVEYYVTRIRRRETDSEGISSAEAVFDIDRDSGSVRISRNLDRETLRGSVVLDVYAVNPESREPHATSCKVHITIHDVNDETPLPTEPEYEFSISENVPVGTVVGRISASDPDLYGKIVFTFTNRSSPFYLDPESGEIRTKHLLDRELTSVYNLEVNINDGEQSSFVPVRIELTDVNDNLPEFIFPPESSRSYSFTVLEGAQRNSYVGRIQAKDYDHGVNGQVQYRMLNSEFQSVFNLNPDTGIITVNGYLDHEEHPLYVLNVQAIDSGNPPMIATEKVFISVQDLNDNPPVFLPSEYEVSVLENVTVGTSLLQLQVQDPDTDTDFEYSVTAGDPWSHFSVTNNGTVVVTRNLDRELISAYHLTVTVFDQKISEKSSSVVRHRATAQVKIEVLDVNDNPPRFLSSNVGVVSENSPVGTIVTVLKASDPDDGLNGQVEFHLDPSSGGVFSVDPVMGFVKVNGKLDREKQDSYTLTVWASDRGNPQLRTKGEVSIRIIDANDNIPKFLDTRFELNIPENIPVGKSILQLGALDKDIGESAAVKFWIISGDSKQEFYLTPDTGILSIGKVLDYERQKFYNLSVGVANAYSVSGSPDDLSNILITLTDVNDNSPKLPADPLHIDVVENFPKDLPAVIGTLNAMDADSGLNGKLSYSIIQGNTSVFRVDSLTGDLVALKQLDREAQASYSLAIQITDSGSPRFETVGNVIVTVLDSNDNSPVFSQPYYVAQVIENARVGTEVAKVEAWDADEGINGLIRYQILTESALSSFQIDVFTGIVRTKATLDRETHPEWTFTVRASDSAQGQPFFSDVTLKVTVLDVNDNAPMIRNSLLDVYIKNSLSSGDFVYAVDAYDPDFGDNGLLEFSLSGKDSGMFQLHPGTGVISSRIPMKTKDSYTVIVTVKDGGTPRRSTSATLHFYALPPAHFPSFKAGGVTQSYEVSEADKNSEVSVFVARSPKQAPMNRIIYSIIAGNAGKAFRIDHHSGKLSTTQNLDREVKSQYELWISATDADSPPLSAFISISVTVTDINDNAPVFRQPVYNATVLEGEMPPVSVIQITARDRDEGSNARITYEILPEGNLDQAFEVESSTGRISTQMTLDRERVSVYQLTVLAKDAGKPQLTGRAIVYVNVEDVNDNAPKFTRLFSASVLEDAEIGTFVTQVTSSDPDSPEYSNNTYYFSSNPGGKFAIDAYTGNVTVAGKLDRESVSEYPLKVIAVDGFWRIETALTISVLDVNDNSPVFDRRIYSFNVSEMQPSLSPVGRVLAKDSDAAGLNSKIRYSLAKKSDAFILDSQTGDLATLKPLFYQTLAGPGANRYQLTVVARDSGTPSRSSSAEVIVFVTDRNKFAPEFTQKQYISSVTRDAMIGSKLVQVEATDMDASGPNSQISYSITGDSDLFAVDPVSGWIRTTGPMGREGEKYVVKVVASDHGNPQKYAETSVEIWILPKNTNSPVFSKRTFEGKIEENSKIGVEVLRISASDLDEGMNGLITYHLETSGHKDFDKFLIDPLSGVITVNGPLDYETQREYNLTVTAKDGGFPSKSTSAKLKIHILDRNDNRPTFDSDAIHCFVSENSLEGTYVTTAKAIDNDSAPNNITKYEIEHGNRRGFFYINSDTGVITVAHGAYLDYETQSLYDLTVIARDVDTNLHSQLSVHIHVTSENEFPPKFVQKTYDFRVAESAPINSFVGTVQAVDVDDGADGVIFYYLEQSSKGRGFSIHKQTGTIRVSEKLSRIAYPSTTLTILAKNRFAASPDDIDTCQVKISVESDLTVPAFAQSSYSTRVTENSPRGTSVFSLARFIVDGPISDLKYGILEGNLDSVFSVDSDSGLVQVRGKLDREQRDHFDLVVTAFSQKAPLLSATTTVHVSVSDVNDNGPHLSPENQVGFIMEGDPVGTNIMQLQPQDSDLEPNRGPFTFRLISHDLAGEFEVDPDSGIIRNKVVFDREERSEYDLLIEMTDSGTPPQSNSETVTVKIRDLNDLPSSGDPLVVVVKSSKGTILDGILGPVKPADPDQVGNYQCNILNGNSAGKLQIAAGCVLVASQVSSPSTHELQLSGNDGIHESVNYTVSIKFQTFEESQLQNAVRLVVSGAQNEILSNFMVQLNEILRREARFGELLAVQTLENDETHELLLSIQDASRTSVQGEIASGFIHALRSEFESLSHFQIVSISYNLCQNNPCENGGECSLLTKVLPVEPLNSVESGRIVLVSPRIFRSFSCNCGNSFAGDRCESMIDHCANSPCRNDGTCRHTVDGVVECECKPAFTGRFCEQDVNECGDGSVGSSPCLNGGYCENHPGFYNCICLVGFAGKNCEISVDHCSSDPCLNGGLCEKLADGYRCKCEFGYSGKNCETRSYGFTVRSYMELPPLNPQQNYLTMEFATKAKDAVLLYSYNKADGSQDYVGLDIVDGQLRLSAKLAGQGRMNLALDRLRVNDGNWYQVQIDHKFQSVKISVGKCSEEISACEPCPVGDSTCRLEAHIGLHQILVPGESILLGGIKSFGDLLHRPGQLSAFSFVGCLRGFEMNGKSLSNIRIKSQANIQDSCPRKDESLCSGDLKDVCGTTAERCSDDWNKRTCFCKGFSAPNCDEAMKPHSFNGGYVEYKLSDEFRKELLFRPVAPESLVNSDDLLRSRRRRATIATSTTNASGSPGEQHPDYWLQIEIRTFSTDGLIFFSASQFDFSIIDLSNGTLRYMSKTGKHQIPPLQLEKSVLSDGQWHKIELALSDEGRHVKLTVDGKGKARKSRVPVPYFLGPTLTRMTVGGLKTDPSQLTSAVKAFGTEVPEFIGCIRTFLLNNQAQPLETGSSGFLDAKLVGEVSSGCSGPLGCVSPPCTLSPLGRNPGMSEGVIAVLVFFGILFVLLIVAWLVIRQRRLKRQHGKHTEESPGPPSTKISNIAIISQTGMSVSPGSAKTDSRNGSRDLVYLNQSRNDLADSQFSLGFPQSRRRPPSSISGAPPPYGMHVGNGAYQNQLDPLNDERVSQPHSAERYDLDNASSIAPSDIEVSYHYRGYREGGSTKKQPLTNPQLARIRNRSQQEGSLNPMQNLNNSGMFRNSPSSVKQLKAALRASPASLGSFQGAGSSEEGPSITSQRSRRPGSAHSARSKKKSGVSSGNGSRSSSRGKGSLKRTPRSHKQSSDGSILSVKDLRRYHSNPSFEDDSSSSSNDQPPVPPMRRFPPSAPRILSRSPHAPPLRDSSSDDSGGESVACSELDLDKVRKPRRLLSMADDTETESEAGVPHGTVPTSLAPFRPPRSMFPVSEDESDVPSIPVELGSSSTSAFQPVRAETKNHFQLKPPPSLSTKNSSPSNWYEEAPSSRSSSETTEKQKNSENPNLEAYV